MLRGGERTTEGQGIMVRKSEGERRVAVVLCARVYKPCGRKRREGEREKKENKIEETFCVIGKRSKRVFALV